MEAVASEALAPGRFRFDVALDRIVDTKLRRDEGCKLVGVHGLRVELGQFLADGFDDCSGLVPCLLEAEVKAMLGSRQLEVGEGINMSSLLWFLLPWFLLLRLFQLLLML